MGISSRRSIVATAFVVLLAIAGTVACSSGDDATADSTTTTAISTAATTTQPVSSTSAPTTTATTPAPASTTAAPTTSVAPAPVEVAFDISGVQARPVPDGGGLADPTATAPRAFEGGEVPALLPTYTEHEYLVAGTAATYSGPATGPATVASTGTPYVTRALVRAPVDPAQFSGRVFLEVFNTSGPSDNDVVWSMIGPMLEEAGDAWIGITVRASSVTALQEFDPIRYAELVVPSNDVEWDMVRHLGGLLRRGGEGSPLPGQAAAHVYLGGFSQSGVDVATFASAFHAETRMADGSPVFDGYLPAGHSGSMTPLQSGVSTLPGFEFTRMRPVDVPVVDIETQTDVEGFEAEIAEGVVYTNPGSATVRRDDSDAPGDLFRLYEVAGAPHAPVIPGCQGNGSTFPVDLMIRGAAQILFEWAENEQTPPTSPRLDLAVQDVVSVAAVDDVGNALGGVRSPFVDVPLSSYDVHSSPGAICKLAGNEQPLSPEQLTARYGSVEGYLTAFTTSLDATIAAGSMREADRTEVLAFVTTRAQDLFTAAG